MKPVRFVGDAQAELRAFPQAVRHDAGYQLHRVQTGEQPADFKPMPMIGPGVEELRVRDATGAYRVIYTARMADAVYVLHAFQKKTQRTASGNIERARQRFKQVMQAR
ncbi:MULTISPECIES: type II toxin-antitoxin system RelE/ParE family toxin [Metallibacterium]|jgi:phage-related protein|uniref:type II toxin-antitoxin system RelE/ParE family toxin n=1 Tax=Metallibacterium TaxID=1218803 RepID=UPI002606ECEC|nr:MULTISPECIES: type II toxin-antitoxin system RelE/ParE family toxin [Metallibacterium]MBW8075778.1 type II toxin-antitoxin system RelE/ParE family toxin [Metallibacterium scheffleri]